MRAESRFRHGGWRPLRERTWRALVDCGAGESRLKRFARCGRFAWLARRRGSDADYVVVASYCRDRWCKPCQLSRALNIARNLKSHLPSRPLRFLTLTLRSDTEPLSVLLDRLIACTRRVRLHRVWKHYVRGGIQFCEVAYNPVLHRWHVHAHIILDGSYFPHARIKRLWYTITQDSQIVDIRLISNPDVAVQYVTRYATKGIDARVTHDRERFVEAISALAGRRLYCTFGDWRGIRLSAPADASDLLPVAPLWQVLLLAKQQDPWALQVLSVIRRPTHWHKVRPQSELTRPPPSIQQSIERYTQHEVLRPMRRGEGQSKLFGASSSEDPFRA